MANIYKFPPSLPDLAEFRYVARAGNKSLT